MAIKNNVDYRHKVFKTLSQKPAQASMRKLAGNLRMVNVAHATTGIATEMGEVLKGLMPYITGSCQLSPCLTQSAAEELGDVLYYVVVLAKMVKVKLPNLSKKSLLKGQTLTSAILQMSVLSTDMLDMTKKNFYGVETTTIVVPEAQKKVRSASPEGFKYSVKTLPEHRATVFDREAQKQTNEKRCEIIGRTLSRFVGLFWPVCYALLEVTPHALAEANYAKLSKRYPLGFFDKGSQENRRYYDEQAVVSDTLQSIANLTNN